MLRLDGKKKTGKDSESTQETDPGGLIKMVIGKEQLDQMASNALESTVRNLRSGLTFPEIQTIITLKSLQDLYASVGIKTDFELDPELFES